MISYTELKEGMFIALNGQPFEVLGFEFLRMQQRKAVAKTRLKNLLSGAIHDQSFQASDEIEEIEIDKLNAKFLYQHRGEYWFSEADNPKDRFMLKDEALGDMAKFLKPNLETTALKYNDKIINMEIPIKVDYKVIEAPPALKGNTAQGGTKVVTIEGGAKVTAPLFINEGDIIKINTRSGDYVERIEKAK